MSEIRLLERSMGKICQMVWNRPKYKIEQVSTLKIRNDSWLNLVVNQTIKIDKMGFSARTVVFSRADGDIRGTIIWDFYTIVSTCSVKKRVQKTERKQMTMMRLEPKSLNSMTRLEPKSHNLMTKFVLLEMTVFVTWRNLKCYFSVSIDRIRHPFPWFLPLRLKDRNLLVSRGFHRLFQPKLIEIYILTMYY